MGVTGAGSGVTPVGIGFPVDSAEALHSPEHTHSLPKQGGTVTLVTLNV